MNFPNLQRCSGQMALALIIVVGFFFVLYALMNHGVPPENRDLVNILLGLLGGTGFAGVITYYFGSSLGSRNKEDTITNTMKTLAPVTDQAPIAPSPAVLPTAAPPPAPLVAAASAPQPSGAPSAP